jgi:predicted protein tyrosine phosphatase
MPKFMILNRAQASKWIPKKENTDVLVSISNIGDDLPMLHDGWRAILDLHFDDVDCATDHGRMTESQAELLLDFFSRWKEADHFIVHCNAGMSRSPGVLLGLLDCFNAPLSMITSIKFPLHNRWVRGLINEVHHGKEPAPIKINRAASL